jgi:hypothetical protein
MGASYYFLTFHCIYRIYGSKVVLFAKFYGAGIKMSILVNFIELYQKTVKCKTILARYTSLEVNFLAKLSRSS